MKFTTASSTRVNTPEVILLIARDFSSNFSQTFPGMNLSDWAFFRISPHYFRSVSHGLYDCLPLGPIVPIILFVTLLDASATMQVIQFQLPSISNLPSA